MEAHNNSFSFTEQITSQPSPRFSKDFNQYEESLIKSLPSLEEYFQKHPLDAPEISITQIQTNDLSLSQQLKFTYNVGIAIDGQATLYQILAFGIIFHLYCDKANEKKLKDLKSQVYSDELEKYLTDIQTINKKQTNFLTNTCSYDELKGCIAHIFYLLEQSSKGKSEYQSFKQLYKLLSNKSFLSYCVLLLRALIECQSKHYKMQLQKQSTINFKAEPEVDILDIITEYFELGINLVYVEEGFLREESFQGQKKSEKTIDLVVNENVYNMPKYICLRSAVQEQEEIDVNTNVVTEAQKQLQEIPQQIIKISPVQEKPTETSPTQSKEQQLTQITMPPINVIEVPSTNIDIKQFYNSNSSGDRQLSSFIEQKQTLQSMSNVGSAQQNQIYETPIKFELALEKIQKNIDNLEYHPLEQGQKTERKPRNKKKHAQHNLRKLKQTFEESMREIRKQSDKVISKAQSLVEKVEMTIWKDERGAKKYCVQKMNDIVIKPLH